MESSVKGEVTRLPRERSDLTSPARYEFEREQIEAIRKTVARDCNEYEFVMFLELAARYQLDPFARQIWAAKMGKSADAQVAIIVGRDGLLSIAERNPHYKDMDSDVVVVGDTLVRNPGTGEFIHEWGEQHVGWTEDGVAGIQQPLILGAWAMVWRDDQERPKCFFARMSEYRKPNSDVWQKYPSAMIQKCAESVALRKAFSIAGLLVEEEVGRAQDVLTAPAPDIEWGDDPKLAQWLQQLVDAANEAKRGSYRKQKLLALLRGRSDDERRTFAQELVEVIRAAPAPKDGQRVIVPDPPEGLVAGYGEQGQIVWHDLLDSDAEEVDAEAVEAG